MTRFLFGIALVLVAVGARAQTPIGRAEYDTACDVLAKLSHQASVENRPVDVVLYVRTAALIRKQVADPTSCRANYFLAVVAANFDQLSAATSVVSVTAIAPLKGWKHREVDDLLVLISGRSPSAVLGGIRGGTESFEMLRDLRGVQIEFEQLKRARPDLFRSVRPNP